MRLQGYLPASTAAMLPPHISRTGIDDLAYLRGLVHGLRCGLLAVDGERRVVIVNEQARNVLGVEDEVPTGTPLAVLLADHPQLLQVIQESFSMSTLPNRAEIELGSRPGSGRRAGFTLSRIRLDGDETGGMAMFFKDLAPIEHKEEQERLRDRLAALGQMAASMAHEIRNPLASIEVTAALLKRRLHGDDGDLALLDKITREVQRLNRCVATSLEYVRPLEPCLAPTDLAALVEEAVEAARERHGVPDILVHCRLRDDLPPFLLDRGLMRQVLLNLLINAMEAIGESGTISVSTGAVAAPGGTGVPFRLAEGPLRDRTHAFDRYAVVRVADDGPGIGAEEQARIFYPFFTTKQGGSGVGLATAKKIVAGHGGRIDVESSPGQGATFIVRLPMVVAVEREGIRA